MEGWRNGGREKGREGEREGGRKGDGWSERERDIYEERERNRLSDMDRCNTVEMERRRGKTETDWDYERTTDEESHAAPDISTSTIINTTLSYVTEINDQQRYGNL